MFSLSLTRYFVNVCAISVWSLNQWWGYWIVKTNVDQDVITPVCILIMRCLKSSQMPFISNVCIKSSQMPFISNVCIVETIMMQDKFSKEIFYFKSRFHLRQYLCPKKEINVSNRTKVIILNFIAKW